MVKIGRALTEIILRILKDLESSKNDPQLLTFVSLLIELFYNDLSIKNNKN